jgi:cytoskeletal protein CcmA (bactofilin family)
MFSSKSKDAAAPLPAIPTPAPAQKRPARSASAPSIISADLVVQGTLSSSGDIQIDGRVEGNVITTGLVIGDKAFVQGDVAAEEVTVRGRVEGSIRARKVLLASTCHVEGDILHEAFAVETGAFFEGNCRHADNPLANMPRPAAEPAAATSAPQPAPMAVSTPAAVAPGAPAAVASAAPAAPRPAAATYAPLNTGA